LASSGGDTAPIKPSSIKRLFVGLTLLAQCCAA
jgi:hypothetical protein